MLEAQPAAFRSRIAVVGGGLSGLTAAFRCAANGAQVTVFESAARWGGAIWTLSDAGFLIEQGAQSFDADSRAVRELARALELTAEIHEPRQTRAYGFDGRALLMLDPGGALHASQGVATFRLGMGQLVDGLLSALAPRAEMHLNARVRALRPARTGWQIDFGAGRSAEFDGVVLAGSGRSAAELLGGVFGLPAHALRLSRSVPSLSVSLAFERSAIGHALDATGFVTGHGVELDECLRCSFVSSKFAGRAPEGSVLLRVFFRPDENTLELPLQIFRDRAARIIERVLNARGAPQRWWEACWRDGFAVMDRDQAARVARLEATLAHMPIALAGSAFHGVGIDAAVRSGEAAARKLRRLG